MQLKTDVMRGQIQKFKMLQYAPLVGVMLGLVLPAGSGNFFSHGNHYTDDVLSLDQECVVPEVIYIYVIIFTLQLLCMYARLMRSIDVGRCSLIIGFPCIWLHIYTN